MANDSRPPHRKLRAPRGFSSKAAFVPPKPKPADKCPFCQGNVKFSTTIVERATLLLCERCQRVGVKGCNLDEWVPAESPGWLDRLIRTAESIRLHREMMESDWSDPRWTWTTIS